MPFNRGEDGGLLARGRAGEWVVILSVKSNLTVWLTTVYWRLGLSTNDSVLFI